MRQNKLWFATMGVLMVLAMVLVVPTGTGAASTSKSLYEFKGMPDAGFPAGGLIFDAAGNLYGAAMGGAYNSGSVFKLTPNADGSWTETVLYSFTGGTDGGGPNAPLIFNAAGNLYGTAGGGLNNADACGGLKCGVVFKLAPNPNGSWTESVVYSFPGRPNEPSQRPALSLTEPVIFTAPHLMPVTLTPEAPFSS